MRRCQRLGCDSSLDHLRSDARYCSPTCRREAQRARAFQSDGATSSEFWDAYRLIRRRRRRTTFHTPVRRPA